jgi:hypothetical protein
MEERIGPMTTEERLDAIEARLDKLEKGLKRVAKSVHPRVGIP